MATSGHCLCGATTYEYDGDARWRVHCHCESCRRQCSAPFTTFFGVLRDEFRWTGQATGVYESSPGVRRHYCTSCGTPMAFDADRYGTEMHLYAASLNDHSDFTPEGHVYFSEKVQWVTLADDLKKYSDGGSAPDD